MKRLYNLDYLRGLAAFGIMIYHYLSWSSAEVHANTFMGRFGIYGVSIFYILSGLTLYYVYHERMTPTKEQLTDFFKKRIFRIFPLLWLATISGVILSRKSPDFTNLFLNLSGLFGFIRWDKYFSPGIWSIGNELVFYIFFPFFIILTKKFKTLMIILSTIIFGIFLYFTFIKLNPDLTFKEQWKDYVNPLNQAFLFLSGYLIGYFLKKYDINNKILITILISGILLFSLYPVEGNRIQLVTGYNRLIFTFSCLAICVSFYKLTIKLPEFLHKPLTLLGEASYSIYLLHPIIWTLVKAISIYIIPLPVYLKQTTAILLTLSISYFVFKYFEKYFINLGRKKA